MNSNNVIGIECKKCHYKTFPKRVFCPNCSSTEHSEWIVPSEGSIFSYTIVNFPLSKYEKAPYTVALVAVDGSNKKPLITARLNTSEISIGQKVNLSLDTFEETGDRLILTAYPVK